MELRAQLLRGTSAVVRSAAATAMAVLAGSLAADPAIYISTGGGHAGGRDGTRETRWIVNGCRMQADVWFLHLVI